MGRMARLDRLAQCCAEFSPTEPPAQTALAHPRTRGTTETVVQLCHIDSLAF